MAVSPCNTAVAQLPRLLQSRCHPGAKSLFDYLEEWFNRHFNNLRTDVRQRWSDIASHEVGSIFGLQW